MFQTKKIKPFLIVCLLLLVTSNFLSCVAQREIRILHMNDFHGFCSSL